MYTQRMQDGNTQEYTRMEIKGYWSPEHRETHTHTYKRIETSSYRKRDRKENMQNYGDKQTPGKMQSHGNINRT